MKLRIHDSSLRIRLSAADIGALKRSGEIVSIVPFDGDSHLVYRVQANGDSLGLTFLDGMISVCVPEPELDQWESCLDKPLCNADIGGIRVLIEEDLPCRHG